MITLDIARIKYSKENYNLPTLWRVAIEYKKHKWRKRKYNKRDIITANESLQKSEIITPISQLLQWRIWKLESLKEDTGDSEAIFK